MFFMVGTTLISNSEYCLVTENTCFENKQSFNHLRMIKILFITFVRVPFKINGFPVKLFFPK